MLLFADIDHISNIANYYQCQCNRHSKQDMIQSLIYKILNKQTMNDHITLIDDIEKTFVMLLYLDQRNQYTMEDLIAKGKKAIQLHQSTKKPRDLILLSLKKGWIFQGVGRKNSLVYLTPEDLKMKILELMRNHFLDQINYVNELPFYRDEKYLLVADFQIFLKFLLNEEVLLTGDGNIYKRQQQYLFNQFSVLEHTIKKQGWRFGYGRRYHEYPDRFSFLYDFCYFNKLIEEDETGLLTITNLGRNYLGQFDPDKVTIDMYRFWIRLYKSTIPYLPFIVQLIDLVAAGHWVLLKDLKNTILFWLKDHYYESKEIIFTERIIKMLHHIGILQIGQIHGESYIRIAKEGHHMIHSFEMFQAKEIQLK